MGFFDAISQSFQAYGEAEMLNGEVDAYTPKTLNSMAGTLYEDWKQRGLEQQQAQEKPANDWLAAHPGKTRRDVPLSAYVGNIENSPAMGMAGSGAIIGRIGMVGARAAGEGVVPKLSQWFSRTFSRAGKVEHIPPEPVPPLHPDIKVTTAPPPVEPAVPSVRAAEPAPPGAKVLSTDTPRHVEGEVIPPRVASTKVTTVEPPAVPVPSAPVAKPTATATVAAATAAVAAGAAIKTGIDSLADAGKINQAAAATLNPAKPSMEALTGAVKRAEKGKNYAANVANEIQKVLKQEGKNLGDFGLEHDGLDGRFGDFSKKALTETLTQINTEESKQLLAKIEKIQVPEKGFNNSGLTAAFGVDGNQPTSAPRHGNHRGTLTPPTVADKAPQKTAQKKPDPIKVTSPGLALGAPT